MTHPYIGLPKKAFWRTSVSDINPLETQDLWEPKWRIQPEDQVVTFGSCFAQHISRALQAHRFSWLNCEPGPAHASAELNAKHNYNIFSARTGNIYSAKALLQWVKWSLGHEKVPDEVWENDGRFYDPFRPAIEPEGFASADEMIRMRVETLKAFGRCIREADVFVFTMGLTESWENREHGYAYATCPGTNAGTFDPDAHVFSNHTYPQIHQELSEAVKLVHEVNPKVRVLLTVSPVPLTATAAGQHVVVSTTYSKSVLRAVAGDISTAHDFVDYFPSYEIITAPNFRGMFYAPNMRSVSKKGVDFVMSHFMGGLGAQAPDAAQPAQPPRPPETALPRENKETAEDDLKCEEALLEAFAAKAAG